MMERQIDYTPLPGGPPTVITVRVENPQPHGDDWMTVLVITGFHKEHRQTFYGVDSMSAVLSAVQMAPVVLASYAGHGTLTWLGDADLKFQLPPL